MGRPFLFVARRFTKQPVRADGRPTPPLGKPAPRTNTEVAGVAATGETSPHGTVAHTEDWEGRVRVVARPATIRYIRDPDGRMRPMTMDEMVDRGYFIRGKGPS